MANARDADPRIKLPPAGWAAVYDRERSALVWQAANSMYFEAAYHPGGYGYLVLELRVPDVVSFSAFALRPCRLRARVRCRLQHHQAPSEARLLRLHTPSMHGCLCMAESRLWYTTTHP